MSNDRMTPSARVFVAGHAGMVGSAICRALERRGYGDVITRTHAQLDLTRQTDTERFFAESQPEFVIVAAARVGGIAANDARRWDFVRDNLLIAANAIDTARRQGVQRLLFLGSSCIYPKECEQPIREEHLLSGPLEPTNRPYAIAKIAAIEMCAAANAQHGTRYVSLMPTNLYGPGDNFDPHSSHVLPAMIRRFDEAVRSGAEAVSIWGSGRPRREFLHSDDLAEAVCHVLEQTDEVQLLNVGSGADISIMELARLVADVVGYTGRIDTDPTKPDGTFRKLLDSSRLRALGWAPQLDLRAGIEAVWRAWRTAD